MADERAQLTLEREEAKKEALTARTELSRLQQMYTDLEQEFGALNDGRECRCIMLWMLWYPCMTGYIHLAWNLRMNDPLHSASCF